MTAPDTALVRRLRAHAAQYHSAHPFHVRMNDGTLTPDQIRGWVANRFAYQEAIPVKDAAFLSNCPDVGVRRRWIRRITDHDGVHDGREEEVARAVADRGEEHGLASVRPGAPYPVPEAVAGGLAVGGRGATGTGRQPERRARDEQGEEEAHR